MVQKSDHTKCVDFTGAVVKPGDKVAFLYKEDTINGCKNVKLVKATYVQYTRYGHEFEMKDVWGHKSTKRVRTPKERVVKI